MMYCSYVDSGRLVCEHSSVQEAWFSMVICRECGMLTFSAIRLKLEMSKMSYCTFNITSLVNTDSTILMAKDGLHMHKQYLYVFLVKGKTYLCLLCSVMLVI